MYCTGSHVTAGLIDVSISYSVIQEKHVSCFLNTSSSVFFISIRVFISSFQCENENTSSPLSQVLLLLRNLLSQLPRILTSVTISTSSPHLSCLPCLFCLHGTLEPRKSCTLARTQAQKRYALLTSCCWLCCSGSSRRSCTMMSMSSAAFLHLCHRLQVQYPLTLSVTVQLYVTAKKILRSRFQKNLFNRWFAVFH